MLHLANLSHIGTLGRRGSNAIPQPDFFILLTSSLALSRGVGSPTFTRNTTATVTDFEGVIRQAKSGEARLEGARRVENLLSYSQEFDNAAWLKNNATVTANAATAPDGTMTADKLVEGTGSIYHSVNQSPTLAASTVYTKSVYAKAAERSWISLLFRTPDGLYHSGFFDLSSGTAGSTANATAAIQNVGNGWYRCAITATSPGAGSTLNSENIQLATGNNERTYTGDGTSGIYIWGAQMENVMEQSVQTAGEYVSTNVLTSAPYHGANVDGVKYFTTKLDGSAIPDATLKGYLAEGQRTNYLLNSATLVTQNVTVTAQAYTLSFSGTGTVTLSGAYSGSLVGTGVSNRVQLTFTPTAGTLVVTVSGTCTKGQLEAGIFASSYTGDTTGTTLTRNADVLSYLSSLFSDTAGTAYVELTPLSWANVSGGILGDGSNKIIAPSYAYGALMPMTA